MEKQWKTVESRQQNRKAKNAEDEKNSLITAMRILFDDNKGTAMTVNNDNHANYEIKRQSEVQIKQQSEVQCSKVLLSNRFSTLLICSSTG